MKHKKKEKKKNLLEGIHDGSFSNMDTIVLVRIGLTPTIKHYHSQNLIFGQLWMIRQFP